MHSVLRCPAKHDALNAMPTAPWGLALGKPQKPWHSTAWQALQLLDESSICPNSPSSNGSVSSSERSDMDWLHLTITVASGCGRFVTIMLWRAAVKAADREPLLLEASLWHTPRVGRPDGHEHSVMEGPALRLMQALQGLGLFASSEPQRLLKKRAWVRPPRASSAVLQLTACPHLPVPTIGAALLPSAFASRTARSPTKHDELQGGTVPAKQQQQKHKQVALTAQLCGVLNQLQ